MAWKLTERVGQRTRLTSGVVSLVGRQFPALYITPDDLQEAGLGAGFVNVYSDAKGRKLAIVASSEGRFSVTITQTGLGVVRCTAAVCEVLGQDWSDHRGRYAAHTANIEVPKAKSGKGEANALIVDFGARLQPPPALRGNG